MDMQVKLLRVLQEQAFERVGGTKTISVDVRVIAATNRNLEKAIKEGRFREDLYYRLNVVSIKLPPLRKRPEDIPLLVAYLIEKYTKKFRIQIKHVDAEVMAHLKSYQWGGNVRQLENFIQHALVMSDSDVLTIKDFPPEILNIKEVTAPIINTKQPLKQSLEEFERQIILKALIENNYHKLRTAEQLGIHRTTFLSKLKKLGIQ